MKRFPLTQWLAENPVDSRMFWKRAAEEQFIQLVAIGALLEVEPTVISTHRSKSITLPVVSFERPDIGLLVVIRGNFYDYKLSVRSERPIADAGFADLFATAPDGSYGASLSSCYFEGFPEDLVFGHYSKNPRRWSASLGDDKALRDVIAACLESATRAEEA